MRASRAGLWRRPDFRLLWAGQTVSQFGSQITLLALPLTAVLVLGATPLQMGLLGAAESAPLLLLSLFAGVWVDQHRRRPLLIGADLGRPALLLLIPLAVALGHLRLELLYVVAFGVGALTTLFEIAYQSYLPALVGRADLLEGNSKLEATRAAAQIAGPGLAGALIGLLTAPATLAIDALSFGFSALCLGRIRAPEAPPRTTGGVDGLRRQIDDGLHTVGGNPALRALAGCSGAQNLASSLQEALILLYATRDLGLGPATLGAIFAAGNVGFLAGALGAGRTVRSAGQGPTILGSVALSALGFLLVPLAGGPPAAVIATLAAARFCQGLGATAYTITGVSLRQTATPDPLLGRVNATFRVLAGGVVPAGALLGGILGDLLGLRPALLAGGLVGLIAVLVALRSPLPALRAPAPEPPVADAA